MSTLSLEIIIGKSLDDQITRDVLATIHESAALDHFAEIEIFEYQKTGIAIYANESRQITTLFLYGRAEDSHARYNGSLPQQVSFDNNAEDLARKLGAPSDRGTEKATGCDWVEYDFPEYKMHIQFSKDTETIKMVTIIAHK